MKHFTINLVSNASTQYYPNNKLSSFRTVLPLENGLQLDGKWEVALSEIVFPTQVKNITDGAYTYRNRSGDDYKTERIPAGVYHSVNDVIMAIKRQVDVHHRVGMKWKFSVDPKTQLLSITLSEGSSYLDLVSTDLKTILGFTGEKVHLNGVGPHVGTFPVDIQRVHAMFVYTDIIQHQIVGDMKAPLLRNVPLFSRLQSVSSSDDNTTEPEVENVISERLYCHQTQLVRAFDVMEYKPVNAGTINTILIELYNEDGHLMPFLDRGRTSLTLLFRQVAQE